MCNCYCGFACVFFNNIKGYFKFVDLCKNEGGLIVFEKLEKDVGWRADNYFDGMFVAPIDGVGFVRFPYIKDDNNEYDLYYIGGDRLSQSSYKKEKSFFSGEPMYEVVSNANIVVSWARIKKVSFEFLKVDSRFVLAVYYDFEYDLFSEEDLFYFDLPTMRCIEGMSSFYEDLNAMFE